MPFTTGPGTISVAIALSAGRPSTAGGGGSVELVPFFAGLSAAAIVVALSIGICYASADRVVSLLRQARARVLTRLSAFLLLCIGVQIFMTGAQGAMAMALSRARFIPKKPYRIGIEARESATPTPTYLRLSRFLRDP